jgi:hypothetical protein
VSPLSLVELVHVGVFRQPGDLGIAEKAGNYFAKEPKSKPAVTSPEIKESNGWIQRAVKFVGTLLAK